ncbi:MAG: ribA [Parcubacteria group bacterium]|nr:ribA [Parcubacteria group bacterium]
MTSARKTNIGTEQINNALYDPTIQVDEETTKTPFVRHFTSNGLVYSCIYTDKEQTALVVIFNEPEFLNTSRVVPIRLHSSCANSDILGSFDCDCRSQLLRSIDILRQENGVLIHLFQEGRGAGIFSKYLGMYTMQSQSLSTYGAYEKLAFETDGRIYSLAFKILKDMDIKKISLLSNNPKKLTAFEEAGFSVNAEQLLGEITPQNFGYLYSKFSEGKHTIPAVFPEEGDYYFCKTASLDGTFRRTWIIDGDDTLWEDNIAYMKIVDDFIEHCLPYLQEITEQEVRQMIDDMEEKVILEHGFGAPGFKISLETIYANLLLSGKLIPRPTELFESIIPTLRSQPETLTADAIAVLSKLWKRGDGLVLYTQGPLSIQFEKIARSGLAEYFHALCVVKSKDVSSLGRLRYDFNLDSGEFLVVGNSLRSDIEPALQAGLRGIHFRNPNSWRVQNISDLDESRYLSINSLTELLDLDI